MFARHRFPLGFKRWLAPVALGCLGSAALLALGVVLEGCGSDGKSTGGKLVVLHTRVELDPNTSEGFTTAVGWNVSLSAASIAAGPFYYFDGTPPLVLRERRQRSELAARWLGIGTAHAHPGHYQAGDALGQMLESSSIDLLAGPAHFPDGNGVTGEYRSARFTFSVPPAGPAAKLLAGHVAVVAGMANKDGEDTRYFRAVADLADLADSVVDGQVDGCEFSAHAVEADGTVTLRVLPDVWFNLVDFSELDVGTEAEPVTFPADSQPQIAFAQGLAELSAYKFAYSHP